MVGREDPEGKEASAAMAVAGASALPTEAVEWTVPVDETDTTDRQAEAEGSP